MSLDLSADLVSLLRTITDVESVSGNEKELADLIEEAMRTLGHLEVHRDGDAVIARTNLGRPERVVIAGHIDTVPVAGNLPSRLEEGERGLHVVGRGTCDMKAGVAVQLKLAAELAEPNRDITWIFYDNEEVGADENGLGRVAENSPELLEADFAVLMEPTDAQIEGGCQGVLRILITVPGKAAHAARSWLGVNAIHGLSDVLDRLNAYEAREVVVDDLTYHEGLNAVLVSGGVATNVIPPSARIEVNYRYAPDKTTEEALAELRRVFEGHSFDINDVSPAARPGLDQPLARAFVESVGQPARPKYGWTDVARFSELGIPAVNYGPGDPSLAHTDHEYCPANQLDQCAEGLRVWLSNQEDDA
ncbi:succinyl-diaminopimelate desuccinylase [Tessaracoccus rhinocerotis]|uniref:Succinyl-diaminopimelate desuccinylase n=1 Tax=Tessaracoccus rhinocerotis TaxID=1689449 RepID=A0A553K264_9ACTN|nr:succinyl-diaminopimelate desuccinylase [Tessaracoccus rhinocerotis]TRY18775.1 succinyl-diaminopimelate desuccinylase [Tessaracoccus rhinocerotis]